jgi:hypothetical protein
MAQAQISESICSMSFNVFNQRDLLAKNAFCVELSVCGEPTQVQYVNPTSKTYKYHKK